MSGALRTTGQGAPDIGDNDSQPCLTDGDKEIVNRAWLMVAKK